MGGVCGTHKVEDKRVHDFGEGNLEDLRVDSSSSSSSSSSSHSPPPFSSSSYVFTSDTTTPAWVLVVCTRKFQAFLSLTIWIQFRIFSSVMYSRAYY